MRTVNIKQVSSNQITIAAGQFIDEDESVTFDDVSFLQVRLIGTDVYAVRGYTPQSATSVKCGHIAVSSNGTRFLTTAEEQQRTVDEQNHEQQKKIASVSAEYLLFQILTDSELLNLIASTDAQIRKGLLHASVSNQINKTDQWFLDLVDRMVSRNIITAARAVVVKKLGNPN